MDPTTQTTPETTPANAPAVTPPAAVTSPAEPKKSSLLSNILGLVAPAKTDVKPTDAEVRADADAAKAKADADAAKAKTDADAAKAKADADADAAAKKVPVRRKETTAAPTADEVRRIAAEEAAKVRQQAPTPTTPTTPPAPDDSDLTPEEREELELAALAEAKDPNRKGFADKFRKFYGEQKAFLEQRAASEGADYDASQDPEYKKFLAKHEPKLPATERKKLREEKIASDATERATKAAEEKLRPEIEQLRTKTLEMEHRPKIQERVQKYVGEVASGMPEEIVKFYNENGRSAEKTREAFPEEFDIVAQSVSGASKLADEALSLRRGITRFDSANPSHQFLDSFVDRQAKAVLAGPAEVRTRDGKAFIHPYEFDAKKHANTHWTFDDEDILESLRNSAQNEAKTRISQHRARVKASVDAAARRSSAPSGANTTPAAVETPPAPSTRTPPAPAPGAATPAPKQSSALSRALGLA